MTKKGDKYECSECGIVVVVDDACGCAACDLICCGAPMKPVKPGAPAKAKPIKATAKPQAKTTTKK